MQMPCQGCLYPGRAQNRYLKYICVMWSKYNPCLICLLVKPLTVRIVADITRFSFPRCSSCTTAICHFNLRLPLWIITSPTLILSLWVPVLVVWVSHKNIKYFCSRSAVWWWLVSWPSCLECGVTCDPFLESSHQLTLVHQSGNVEQCW